MKGDFTRDTFDAKNHFSRVLMQQGRVTLDADNNEQASILLHYLRTLARDIIGPYAAPVIGGGFQISAGDNGDLNIGAGRFYVDGILVENDVDCAYTAQPYLPLPEDDKLLAEMKSNTGQAFWLYLDVWERHITYIEENSIREVALGGPDTCTRAKVVWQVKALPVDVSEGSTGNPALDKLQQELKAAELKLSQTTDPTEQKAIQSQIDVIKQQIERLGPQQPRAARIRCDTPLGELTTISDAQMAARVDPGQKSTSPCITSPDSKYRGLENHLYRVEIHRSGPAGTATFKWSRDNGSVVTAWVGGAGNDLQVANSRGFTAGCWVELTDDTLDLQGEPGMLVKLAKVEPGVLTVDSSTVPSPETLAFSRPMFHPKIRRWDQVQIGDTVLDDGAVPIQEEWFDLEDGVQIQFSPGGTYRSGDYWLIPARVATGKIEWPAEMEETGEMIATPQPPRGIEHHYAPLGFIRWIDKNLEQKGCRCEFDPLSSCFAGGSIAVGAHLIGSGRNIVVNTLPNRAPVTKKAAARKRK